ncbi:hypothetical protein N9J84_01565 [Porticoccaceae bacterium]|nr:hypothetical protein [Porticoccaceae bacterium]
MSNCRVSSDEFNHDHEQTKLNAQYEAAKGDRELAVEKTYQKLINDPVWLWEALGPDGYKPPNNAQGLYYQQRNRIAEEVFRQSVSDAVLTNDDAGLGRILGDMARNNLRNAAENKHE